MVCSFQFSLALLRNTIILAQEGVLGPNEIEAIFQAEHESMWAFYYDAHFEGALKIESSLLEIVQHLKKWDSKNRLLHVLSKIVESKGHCHNGKFEKHFSSLRN